MHAVDEQCARVAQGPTLFYMPHCITAGFGRLLRAHAGCLDRIAILGNSLLGYRVSWKIGRSEYAPLKLNHAFSVCGMPSTCIIGGRTLRQDSRVMRLLHLYGLSCAFSVLDQAFSVLREALHVHHRRPHFAAELRGFALPAGISRASSLMRACTCHRTVT